MAAPIGNKNNLGRKHSEETKRKLSELNKGKHHSESTKEKISKGLQGHITSEQTKKLISENSKKTQKLIWQNEVYRKHMSEVHKGKPSPLKGTKLSEERKLQISQLRKGTKLSEEHKRNIGNSSRGRIMSEEAKQKISKANKGKPGLKENDHPSKRLDVREKISRAKKGVQTGQIPWTKGKHGWMTEEHKESLRRANIGKKRSEESINKFREKMCGEKHPNWQGGISFEPYCHKFNNQLRERIRERDSRTCQYPGCGKKENGRRLDVHHIHYDKTNCAPDLITLCGTCNTKVNKNRDYWEAFFMNLLRQRGLLL